MATKRTVPDIHRSYNSISGSSIKAVIGGRVFGELQAITYAVSREKAPIFTLGSAEPRAFSRNKRAIAGSLGWTNFDRNAMVDHFKNSAFWASVDDIRPEWDPASGDAGLNATLTTYGIEAIDDRLASLFESPLEHASSDHQLARPWYVDQIPPFDIVLVANNEMGAACRMAIVGVELMSEGQGLSVDDANMESQSTYAARGVIPWTEIPNIENRKQIVASTAF